MTPKHTSGTVNDYIRKNNIHVLPNWPASSPDLNPIENIWSVMKNEISKQRPETLDELENVIRRSWRNIPQIYINNCIESMPKMLQLLLNNLGNKIPY